MSLSKISLIKLHKFSDGRHYNGYREDDDEGDKYFCPDTGAHFEFSEVVRKLNRYKHKQMQKLDIPSVKPQLSIREEATKSSLGNEGKSKVDVKNNPICKYISIMKFYF
jgi:hypothetical protein